ncbi:MAG: hypothetical protein NTU57_01300 [Candidatus Aenigmarchaeota archaeon]|nr:hypothetical protein [Candidatus Aenigmarchaeota archaeon]
MNKIIASIGDGYGYIDGITNSIDLVTLSRGKNVGNYLVRFIDDPSLETYKLLQKLSPTINEVPIALVENMSKSLSKALGRKIKQTLLNADYIEQNIDI